jgi:hypothetical protein
MELVDGVTLRQYIDGGPPGVADVLMFGAQIALWVLLLAVERTVRNGDERTDWFRKSPRLAVSVRTHVSSRSLTPSNHGEQRWTPAAKRKR